MKKGSLAVSFIILAVFFYFLYEYNVFQNLRRIFSELSLPLLLLSLVLYIFTYYFRAKRFTVFFPQIKTVDLAAVIAVHTFFNNLLPFRSGEASFPLILKKIFGVETVISSTTLVVARLFDLLSLVILFTVATFGVSVNNRKFLGISLLLAVLIVLALVLGFKLLKLLKKRFGFASALFFFFTEFKSFRNLILVFLYSLLNWLTKFAAFYFIMRSGGLNLNFFESTFVATFGELTTILPVHSIGGFGTYEAGLVGGFALLGFKGSYALTVAFYFHLLLFTMSGFLAFLGWIYLSRRIGGR